MKKQGSVTASLFAIPSLFLLLLSWPQAALQQHCPEENPVFWLISVCWGRVCSGHCLCLLTDGNLQVQS